MKSIDLWLTLWGVYVAFLTQVFYDIIPASQLFLDYPAKQLFGLVVAALALTILAVLSVRSFKKKVKDNQSTLLWKISIKNNDNDLEAMGTDAEELRIVLKRWKENTKP